MNAAADGIDDPAPDAEEAARSQVYGVLAALFHAAPDVPLLASLRAVAQVQDGADSSELEVAWQQLGRAALSMEPQQIAAEYDALFGGVGKPEVYLFGSHYLSGFLNDKPLANLRGDLARLGIARLDALSETEDHFSCLCDAMRRLIGEDADPAAARLDDQHSLFARHIAPWAEAMCDAIEQHPHARFYAVAARFARAFIAVERQAFEMLEAEGGG